MRNLKAFGGWIISAFLFAWSVIKFALDWVGRSTAPDDWGQLMDEKLPAFFNWLYSTPAWVPGLIALILAVYMIWVNWPTKPNTEADTNAPPPQRPEMRDEFATAPEPTEQQELARGDLINFTLDHVVPTIRLQREAQKAVIREHQGLAAVGDLAVRGILHGKGGVEDMAAAYDKVSDLLGSPLPDISLAEMEEIVFTIEQNYRFLVSQGYHLLTSVGIDHRREHQFSDEWKEWWFHHDKMAAEYDKIRRDPRFKKLFRPGLPNRLREGEA